MTKTIEITSKSQVEKINQLASKAPYEVWLSADAVMLDARSLLGLFARRPAWWWKIMWTPRHLASWWTKWRENAG